MYGDNISQKLLDLTKEASLISILESVQNYMLALLKANPQEQIFIKHIKYVEDAINQSRLGMRPINILDELCLKIIT